MAENENNGIKITDLPESAGFDGLYTLGSNAGKAYKVSLSGWEATRKDAAAAATAADNAATAANTAARTATEAAAKVKDGSDGKTPVIGMGTVTDADTASAALVADGTDENDNPKYKLNLSLPKGEKGLQGDPGKDGTDGTDGADGKTPVITIGTVTTVASTEQAAATLVADGVDAEGNPKYKLDLSLPKGEKGAAGTGSGNVSADGTGLAKDRKYLFVPSSDNSTEGVFVEYTAPVIPANVSELENDAGYAVAAEVATELAKKVDKVTGKGLSTNDYTTAEKQQVSKIAGIQTELAKKVDKVTGKGLSTNDYTTAEKQQVSKIAGIQTELAKKVEVSGGKIEVEQGTDGFAAFIGTYNGYEQGGMEVSYGNNTSGDAAVTTFLHSNGNGLVIFNTGRVRFRVYEQDRDFNDNPDFDIDANWGTIGNVAKIKFDAGRELVGGCPLKVVNETTGTVTLVRGMLHVISGQTTIDISVPAETDGFAGEYNLEIVAGDTAPTVSFPSTLKWDGGEAPTIEAGKTYHIVIFRGVGYCSQGV